jgi:hypothetical protein
MRRFWSTARPQLRCGVVKTLGPLLLIAVLAACGAHPSRGTAVPSAGDAVRQVVGRPPVGVLVREGDPSAAVAVAVVTSGAFGHGAEVAVALSAVVEARLNAAGLLDFRVVPGAEGFRVRVLLEGKGRAPAVVAAIREALLSPLVEGGPELALVEKKLAALASRPLPDLALSPVAECTGEPFAPRQAGSSSPGAATPVPGVNVGSVEAWRAASLGLGRVAFAVVGTTADVDAVATAVAEGPAWPVTPTVTLPRPPLSPGVTGYDATLDTPAGAARATLVAHTKEAERAVVTADRLGDPRGELSTRLHAIEPLAHLRDVTATAHLGWGCVRVTIDLPSPDGNADPPANLALALDLAEEEISAELAQSKRLAGPARELANHAGDPRDAAERLAYWTLRAGASSSVTEVAPGIATVLGFHLLEGRGESELGNRVQAVRAELARVSSARREPVGEMRVRVERGQSSLWLLVASPCGTETEVDSDAGDGALGVLALAARARRESEGMGATHEGDSSLPEVRGVVEEWTAADGLGLVVHASPMPGESGAALARRVATLAARAFIAPISETRDTAAARGALLSRLAASDDSRLVAAFADAVSPGHPSWIVPWGTSESLERSSDDAVRVRLDALRAGPLRVAVLADQDAAQGDVALEALGAWLPHRSHRSPSCPASATPSRARPGTYAVETSGASAAEAWLAFPLEAKDHADARVMAVALGAEGGLLEKALGSGLARSWGAKVMGPAKAPVLVVRVASPQASLDAAVAEARVLFDRLRQKGLTEAERAAAVAELDRERLESSLDPKVRLVSLWRGESEGDKEPPKLETIQAFAAKTLRDEALVVVVSRPPRVVVSKGP